MMERLVDRNRAEAYAYLSELQARVGVHVENRLQVEDSAVSTLHRLVEEEGADLVILSAHGYSGEARWPYGSVVVSFISYGTTPLIIIQDLPPERIELSKAEITARELGRR
jgi:nucleotide-binding universal stress UspA family protein